MIRPLFRLACLFAVSLPLAVRALPPDAGEHAAEGPVVETMEAGGYTYVAVDAGGRTVWAATLKTAVATGEVVIIPPGMVMRDFHSPTLDRTFEAIRFIDRIGRPGEEEAMGLPPGHPPLGVAGLPAGHPPIEDADYGGHGLPPGHPPLDGATDDEGYLPPGHPSVENGDAASRMRAKIADDAAVVAAIETPEGGLRIADLHARAGELAGATVTVRGQAVKVTDNILGRNWVHLRDGSGVKGRDDDLTVTTDAKVAVGEVVTAEGVLAIDRDFGYGYNYPVILEQAVISR